MARWKRIGRYLAGRPVLEWLYLLQELPKRAVYQTLGRGEDKVIRKSIASCYCCFGQHLLETRISGQAVIALSSGESELYALGKGASRNIVMRKLLSNFGVEAVSVAQRHSNAARGIATKTGSGIWRHLAIRDLWVQ